MVTPCWLVTKMDFGRRVPPPTHGVPLLRSEAARGPVGCRSTFPLKRLSTGSL